MFSPDGRRSVLREIRVAVPFLGAGSVLQVFTDGSADAGFRVPVAADNAALTVHDRADGVDHHEDGHLGRPDLTECATLPRGLAVHGAEVLTHAHVAASTARSLEEPARPGRSEARPKCLSG